MPHTGNHVKDTVYPFFKKIYDVKKNSVDLTPPNRRPTLTFLYGITDNTVEDGLTPVERRELEKITRNSHLI